MRPVTAEFHKQEYQKAVDKSTYFVKKTLNDCKCDQYDTTV